VDTLYRRAILCCHGFSGSSTVTVGGQVVPVLSSVAASCGGTDQAMVVGLDDTEEGGPCQTLARLWGLTFSYIVDNCKT
jgi:hypothetical protein